MFEIPLLVSPFDSKKKMKIRKKKTKIELKEENLKNIYVMIRMIIVGLD